MSYLTDFSNIATGGKEILQLARDGKAIRYVCINVLVLGLLFGLSNFLGAFNSSPELPIEGKYAFITPFIFSVAGILTVTAALFGYSLIYWAAAKAFGGHGTIMTSVGLIGVTCMPFWFIAPLSNYLVNYNVSKIFSLLVLGSMAFAAAWLFRLTKKSLGVGMGLSENKSAIAICCMWIFSVSSVYVFLP